MKSPEFAALQDAILNEFNQTQFKGHVTSIDLVGSRDALFREARSGEMDLLITCDRLALDVVRSLESTLYAAARSFWKRKDNRLLVETRRGPFKPSPGDFQVHAIVLDPPCIEATERATLLDWRNKAYRGLEDGNIMGDLNAQLPDLSQEHVKASALNVLATLQAEFDSRLFWYLQLSDSSGDLRYSRMRCRWDSSDFMASIFCE